MRATAPCSAFKPRSPAPRPVRSLAGRSAPIGRPLQHDPMRSVTTSGSASGPPPPPPAPSDWEAVKAYVCSGPLFPQLGLSSDDATESRVAAWESLASQLRAQLDFHQQPNAVDDAAEAARAARVYRYYLPVYLWCTARLETHRDAWRRSDSRASPPPPLVIGLSAPQGCGKTTIVTQLQRLLAATGFNAASISIDDVYLTGAEQEALAAANPGNALLKFRGNAGSHDVALGVETLRALKRINEEGDGCQRGRVAVPRYDKTMRGGRGDRASASTWPTVEAPLDVVLLEGWMLGFNPVGAEVAAAIDPDLVQVDAALSSGGYDALHALVDDWMVVTVGDPKWVFQWRLQAEVEARAAGKPTLTDDEVADFVARFMPAYVAYLPGLYGAGPGAPQMSEGEGEQEEGEGDGAAVEKSRGAGSSRVLTIRVDRERNVIY